MAAFKHLLDTECGTTNPLIKLSQIYTHVPQNGLNEHDKHIIVPNTFHLQSLLSSLHATDTTVNQWTNEFLNTSTDHISMESFVTNVDSERIPWIYLPPSSSFILRPNPLFLDQQPYSIDTGFDTDIVRATENLLSFLHERQFAVNTENFEHMIDVNDTKQEITHETKGEERQYDEKILETINPFEEGLKCLTNHDIANAILFFQIAVKKQPDHIDAWLYLGITQTKNEQDSCAIFALKKCIEIDSKNLQAYLTLASCYANEMQKIDAFNSLYQWLANNNKYSHLLLNRPSYSIAYNQLTFEDLEDLFLQAVSCSNNSNEIDTDLQVCLGLLFHLNDDYNKAAECFYTAVLTKPNDALLWNKLGTTIVNSGENEKAVNAYYNALILSPDFIRARYNLGICCMNLKAYQQAVEHFLIALKLQTQMNMSTNIWRTLALAINHLKRLDLEQCVVYKDLSTLLHEFQIE